jgi:hypothetical protein
MAEKIDTRFLRKLIKPEVLPLFPGFVERNAELFVVPMNHIWRAFSFQKSTSFPHWYVWYNVLPLYMPIQFSHVGLGGRLGFHNRHFMAWYNREIQPFDPGTVPSPAPVTNTVELWVWDELGNPVELIEALVSRLKAAKADILDKFETPLDVPTNGPAMFGLNAWNHIEIYAYSFIYAEQFSQAVPLLNDLLAKYRSVAEHGAEHITRTEMLLSFLLIDPARAKAQLQECENQSIKNLKLEKYPNRSSQRSSHICRRNPCAWPSSRPTTRHRRSVRVLP